nr:DUF1643 domain-containing protein [Bifidobacterium bombi]
MNNPSDADAVFNDKTTNNCIRIAKEAEVNGKTLKSDGIVIYNVFSKIAKKPKDLPADETAIGDSNDVYLSEIPKYKTVILGWGMCHNPPQIGPIWDKEMRTICNKLQGNTIYCVNGVTTKSRPRHPASKNLTGSDGKIKLVQIRLLNNGNAKNIY